ncbi:MAG: RNA 2'-phosphotransferase [Cyanobacteria bacterium SBLK]|nr:RNA 2'-phosphotransferase [Cyanobacteria bacterium SBLK]
MLSESRLRKISKYLSYHLRHRPDELGLELEVGGWVEVPRLLAACRQKKFSIQPVELEEVVRRNDKKRFSFNEDGSKIRANQGHSIEIDLQLEPQTPPDVLYHGTGHPAVPSILKEGLVKMSRHHVHLSGDRSTAKKVGQRHGKPVIFQIDTEAMQKAGYLFYLSANGVWLVDRVPPEYLTQL